MERAREPRGHGRRRAQGAESARRSVLPPKGQEETPRGDSVDAASAISGGGGGRASSRSKTRGGGMERSDLPELHDLRGASKGARRARAGSRRRLGSAVLRQSSPFASDFERARGAGTATGARAPGRAVRTRRRGSWYQLDAKSARRRRAPRDATARSPRPAHPDRTLTRRLDHDPVRLAAAEAHYRAPAARPATPPHASISPCRSR